MAGRAMGFNWDILGEHKAAGRGLQGTNGYTGGRHCWVKHFLWVFSAAVACSAASWDKCWSYSQHPAFAALFITNNKPLEYRLNKLSVTEGGLQLAGLKERYNWQRSGCCHHFPCGDICPWPKLVPTLHRDWRREYTWSCLLRREGGHHQELMGWSFLRQNCWWVDACPWLKGELRVRPSVNLCRRSPCRES